MRCEGARARQAESRPRGRTSPRGREARGRDRAAADRPRRPRRDRGRPGPAGDRLRGRHARSGCAERSGRQPQASSPAGGRRSPSGSRSRPGSAGAAPTPRPRFGSPTTPSPRPSLASACAPLRPHSARTSRSSSVDGPQLGRGDGSELDPLDLPQDYWIVLALPQGAGKDSTAAVYRRFDERNGADGWEQRRDALEQALAAVRRPRDLAALPLNDLASSPHAPGWPPSCSGAEPSAPTSAGPAQPCTASSTTGATPTPRGGLCGAPPARG